MRILITDAVKRFKSQSALARAMGQTPGSIWIQRSRSDYLSAGQMLILRERHPVITRELLALAKDAK